MNNIVGIDLGTTNTVVARLDVTGDPEIQPNLNGNNLTPSAVYIRDKDDKLVVTVGGDAQLVEDFERKPIYKDFKRDIGQQIKYDTIGGNNITPETLSALVLEQCRRDFVAQQDEDITNCIITYPGHFNYQEREATVLAGKSAGWPIVHGINEPSAAALYYAIKHTPKPGKYAVYDFGGGTWDISVVEIDGLDINFIKSDGIYKCGGKDFDDRLQVIVEEKFEKQTGSKIDWDKTENIKARLFEPTKKSLTRLPERTLGVLDENGTRINIEVTRDEFEASIGSILAGTEMMCQQILEHNKDIIDVILVGGSTRVPAVKKSVEKIFGKPGITIGNPDETVALGAALYSGLKSDKKDLNAAQIDKFGAIEFNEVANNYFGTSAVKFNKEAGKWEKYPDYIIEKGTPLPCSSTQVYLPIHDNQTSFITDVFESGIKEEEMQWVEPLYDGGMDLPPGVKTDDKLIVTFEKMIDERLNCTFLFEKTGLTKKVNLLSSSLKNIDSDINDSFEFEQ